MNYSDANDDPLVAVALLAIGLYLVAVSLLMLVAPGVFYEEIGPFGPRNDHYIRDAATFQVAIGVLALGAFRRPSWRTPALIGLLVNFVLHAANHLLDIGGADPAWVGPADFAGLAIGAVAICWLLLRQLRGTGAG